VTRCIASDWQTRERPAKARALAAIDAFSIGLGPADDGAHNMRAETVAQNWVDAVFSISGEPFDVRPGRPATVNRLPILLANVAEDCYRSIAMSSALRLRSYEVSVCAMGPIPKWFPQVNMHGGGIWTRKTDQ